MNGICNEIPAWPRARWVGSVLAVFALQLALILVLADHAPVVTRHVESGTRLSMVTDRAAVERLARAVAANDPTVYALANPRGFSGPAWLEVKPLEHTLADWKDREHWLSPGDKKYGATFNGYVRQNAMTPDGAPAMPAPQLDAVNPANPELLEKSRLVVLGDLKQRKLLATPRLPVWPSPDILGSTVLQVVVNGDGETVSITLLAGTGLAAADQKALEIARQVHFEKAPKGGAELTWGQLVFQWKTAPQRGASNTVSVP